jgi:hypothetical protein
MDTLLRWSFDRDLAGLYLSPPVAAAVYAAGEKPQIQALNRSAPILPMLPAIPQKATRDYVRNGTLALNLYMIRALAAAVS